MLRGVPHTHSRLQKADTELFLLRMAKMRSVPDCPRPHYIIAHSKQPQTATAQQPQHTAHNNKGIIVCVQSSEYRKQL